MTEGDKADGAKALDGAVVEPGHDSILLDIIHSIQSLIECQILSLFLAMPSPKIPILEQRSSPFDVRHDD